MRQGLQSGDEIPGAIEGKPKHKVCEGAMAAGHQQRRNHKNRKLLHPTTIIIEHRAQLKSSHHHA